MAQVHPDPDDLARPSAEPPPAKAQEVLESPAAPAPPTPVETEAVREALLRLRRQLRATDDALAAYGRDLVAAHGPAPGTTED